MHGRGYATLGIGLCALVVTASALSAQSKSKSADRDPRWATVQRVFGVDGETKDGYFRIQLPRSDLKVQIGNDVLETPFELTSYAAFIPIGKKDVLAMGEYVVRADEATNVIRELRRAGVSVPALHNHLIGESPRIMFIHVMVRGSAESVASKLKGAFQKSDTPIKSEPDQPSTVDWKSIDAVLGKHSEAKGHTVSYEFPRNERIAEAGVAVKSTGMLETASEVVLQDLGGGRAACGGELFVAPNEIDAVSKALEEHGIHVTAIHNHMIDQTPLMYWMHWYGTGNAVALARGVAAALEVTNGAHKSKGDN